MDLRVAAYAVITDTEERVLLAHWKEGRRSAWTMPGGGLEPGEDPADAARREVWEETGYHVAIGELLGIDSRVIPGTQRVVASVAPLHTLRIVYRAEITGGHLRNETNGSTDMAEWFALSSLGALRHVKLVDVAMKMAGLDR